MSELNIQKLNELMKGLIFLEFVDEGGQKIVYKANFEDNIVAAKLLFEPTIRQIKRINRELELLRKFKLPNIVKLVKVIETNYEGKVCLIILEEFIEGTTLKKHIKNNNITPNLVISVADSILSVLEELEKEKIVHRDIKPDNIMVNENKITLLDFGIARDLTDNSITQDFEPIGPCTKSYAAPEQLINDKIHQDSRTDFFSLGIVLFEMISGFNPFLGRDNPRDICVVTAIMNNDKHELFEFVEHNKFNDKLNIICLKLMEPQPFKRYRRVDFIKKDIDELRLLI